MTEAALQAAALVAHRFTVITMPPRTIAMTDRVVRALGLGHRCTVRAVDVAVADIESGAGPAYAAFAEEARTALVDGRCGGRGARVRRPRRTRRARSAPRSGCR